MMTHKRKCEFCRKSNKFVGPHGLCADCNYDLGVIELQRDIARRIIDEEIEYHHQSRLSDERSFVEAKR